MKFYQIGENKDKENCFFFFFKQDKHTNLSHQIPLQFPIRANWISLSLKNGMHRYNRSFKICEVCVWAGRERGNEKVGEGRNIPEWH